MNTLTRTVYLIALQIQHNFMDRLAPEQKQVLLKMKSSTNPAYQFDIYYKPYIGHHFEMRYFDYRWIAYYLEQSERQEIYEYFQRKYAFQKDEKVQQDYEWFRSSMEKYNEKIREHVYSQRDINLKNAMKAHLQQTAKKALIPQMSKEAKLSIFGSVQKGINNLWRMICSSEKQTSIRLSGQVEQEKTKLN